MLKQDPIKSAMYLEKPPTKDLTIEQLEKVCMRRMGLLKDIERMAELFAMRGKGAGGSKAESKDEEMRKIMTRHHLEAFGNNTDKKEADQISHFMFRLAFCKTEECRLWFISQETKLFSARMKQEEKIQEIERILKEFGFDMKPSKIENGEKNWVEYTRCLNLETRGLPKITFYPLEFEKVPKILRTRKYYLNKGYLMVPDTELVTAIEGVFKQQLQNSLLKTQKKEMSASEDSRIFRILEKIRESRMNFGMRDNKAKIEGKIRIEEIDKLSRILYPPCMKVLHHGLKANSHLKHFGRMQYGLFLKGVGITLEESIQFWKMEFTKKMSLDQFQKNYLYNIRHNYGREGKHADYVPWSCTKILNLSPPGPGEYHGCPFKTFSRENLERIIRQYKLSDEVVKDILQKKDEYQYQLCCLRLFEAINPGIPNAGTTPHHFFIEGFNALRQNQKIAPEASSKSQAEKMVDIQSS